MNNDKRIFARYQRIILILIGLMVAGLFESGIRLLSAYDVLHIKTYPVDVQPRFIDVIDPVVGMWHHAAVSGYAHTLPCRTAFYSTNAQGARDPARAEQSAQFRVVVLGDSFIEGRAVSDGDRLTDRLERTFQRPFLNFGCAGFSPIQEWLIYEKLASRFDHQEIHLYILPANDFDDMNPDFPITNRFYRPYLRHSGQSFELYYTKKFNKDLRTTDLSVSKRIMNILSNNWYTYNVIRQGVAAIRQRKLNTTTRNTPDRPGSYSNRPADELLDYALYSYGNIIKQAKGRPVRFFIIPDPVDFRVLRSSGYHFPLIDRLLAIQQQYDNVTVHDLLPDMNAELERRNLEIADIFVPCDGHWNELGHELAALSVASVVGAAWQELP
ncbi:MAG: hypothetical protein HQL80_11060 [Magnetococcales bacterium]|nr:hypothetical protein [Magnetococcales bacterium]